MPSTHPPFLLAQLQEIKAEGRSFPGLDSDPSRFERLHNCTVVRRASYRHIRFHRYGREPNAVCGMCIAARNRYLTCSLCHSPCPQIPETGEIS